MSEFDKNKPQQPLNKPVNAPLGGKHDTTNRPMGGGINQKTPTAPTTGGATNRGNLGNRDTTGKGKI